MKLHSYYITGLIICAAVIYFLLSELQQKQIHINDQASVIKEQNSEITLRKNFEGRVIAEKNAAETDLETFKKSYPKLLEDINRKLEIKTKNILVAIDAKFSAHGSGTVQIIHDSITTESGSKESIVHVEIDDGYLKAKAKSKSPFIHVDYEYDYSDTLLLAIAKKKSFFKGETLSISGVLSNPNANITHTTGVLIHNVKPKRFNISVGMYYDPVRNQFGPGITAGYALIRL